MTGTPAGDAQVQMLFGHLLTPQVTGEVAKQPAAQRMDVDAHSRKRQRQAKTQQPKGKGRGRAGRGGRRQESREEDSTASSERELVLALGRIVLNQADQLHRLECDTGYFLVLATAPGPRHDHPDHVQCGGTLAETTSRKSGTAHLFIGCHDVQVSPPRDEQSTLPCPEDEGGPRGTTQCVV